MPRKRSEARPQKHPTKSQTEGSTLTWCWPKYQMVKPSRYQKSHSLAAPGLEV